MHAHVKKNDLVMVISGAEKGKQGKINRIEPDGRGGGKVWVEKLHLVKRHSRANPANAQARTGGILEKEAPLALSNVLPICPKEDKPRRVKLVEKNGERIRVCAKCKEPFAS